MTIEEHLRAICGAKDFELASLRAAIDTMQAKLREYEGPAKKALPQELKAPETETPQRVANGGKASRV